MTAQEIRGGLQVDGFWVRVYWFEAQGEWVIQWFDNDTSEQTAQAAFRETDDGIEWTRFYVREEFRNRGVYTQALKWSLSLDGTVTASGLSVDPTLWAGFKRVSDGDHLKIDKRVAKARVKVG